MTRQNQAKSRAGWGALQVEGRALGGGGGGGCVAKIKALAYENCQEPSVAIPL